MVLSAHGSPPGPNDRDIGERPSDEIAHASLSSVERAMLVFEALSDSRHGVSVTELSARLRINKGLVHRILTSLTAMGYVAKDDISQNYRMTTRLLSLAFRQLRQMDMYDILLPVLRRLALDTGELAELNWVEKGRLVLVAKADSPRRVKVVDYLGEEQYLHASACGKVWLASLPEEEALRMVVERGMPRVAENTITNLMALQQELRKVREAGYAINDRELDSEVISVAAPVYAQGGAGQVIGAVSAVGPAYRKVHEDRRVIDLTVAAAHEISSVWPFVSLER